MPRFRRLSRTTILVLSAWVAFCGWVLAGWSSALHIEEPPYTVIRKADGYELRQYSPQLAAVVSATGPWSEAYAFGSALLLAYAGGDNTIQESVAAGRPIGMEPQGRDIAQSVPLFAAAKGDGWLISFVMPARWTEVTLPRPNDPRIRVVRLPGRTVAVLTFSGGAGRDQADSAQEKLRELLARDKVVILGPATVAQYHSWWAPPFLRRNEIIVPIRP